MATTFNPEANDQTRELTTDELATVSGGNPLIFVDPLDTPSRAEVWDAFADAANKGGAGVPYM